MPKLAGLGSFCCVCRKRIDTHKRCEKDDEGAELFEDFYGELKELRNILHHGQSGG